MKRIIVVAVALAFVLLSAGAALAGIAGSKHDMRTHLDSGHTLGYDEVCVYCHTPHGGNQAAAPLWNHTGTAIVSYTVYTSSTMNAIPSVLPGAGSLLCLSCHDGTVAVDAMIVTPTQGGVASASGTGVLDTNKRLNSTSSALLDTNLTNDHPIGFTYQDAASVDTGLYDLATVQGRTAVRLIGGTEVECASCHDAHNTTNMPFLRSTNQGSLLCLACHNK